MSKELLRKELRSSLKNLMKSEIEQKSSALSNNLYNLISLLDLQRNFSPGLMIGTYLPILQEPKWFLDKRSIEYDYALVHMHEECCLSFHRLSLEVIKSGNVGLKLKDEFLRETKTPDILLIPGLGFTSQKERLGRGRGYYDSYLKDFEGIKIGLFFDQQLVENVHAQEHDEKLNYIVTETKTY